MSEVIRVLPRLFYQGWRWFVRFLVSSFYRPYFSRATFLSLINGGISIAVMATFAAMTHSAFIFPSLGATAFLFFTSPMSASASPRSTIIGHAIGIVMGYLSLVLTGLTQAGPALAIGVTGPRIIAVGLSLATTSFFMLLLRAPHAPAAATTLIVSLGILPHPNQLIVMLPAVLILTLQAYIFNRLVGIPYPRWNPVSEEKPLVTSSSLANTEKASAIAISHTINEKRSTTGKTISKQQRMSKKYYYSRLKKRTHLKRH